MAYEILMPALSPTMKEGVIVKWYKKEGDVIRSSEILLDIETDKATMEVEAVDEGILKKIFFDSGVIQVGTLIGLIGEVDEDISDFCNKKTVVEAKKEETKKEQKQEQLKVDISDTNYISNKIVASPLAKKIAKNLDIDISLVKGTGPKGRIIKNDVENFNSSMLINSKESCEVQKTYNSKAVPLSNIQKIIAKRLLESKQNIPHFYLSIDIIIDELLNLKKQIEDQIEKKISVNDFIIKACATALELVPEVNVSLENDMLISHESSDVSVAVAIDSGLITPIVKNAQNKSILEISKEVKELVKKAKDGTLKPADFQGGTFTISNLGMFGINSFQAIINPPQSAILAVGAGIKKSVVIDDEILIRTVMNVNLSLDHRVLGGAEASKFLNVLKDLIEKPYKILL